MKLEFEPMNEKNIAFVAELERISFANPWSEAALEQELKNKTACFFVAKSGVKVVGYMGMHVVLDEAYIANIAVMPEYRGKGFGKSLLLYAHELAEDKGVKTISLEVRPSNLAAIGLYKKLGYEEKGRRKNFYSKPQEDGLILTKEL